MYAYSLVIKVDDGPDAARKAEALSIINRHFPLEPINSFVNTTSEPTQINAVVTTPEPITEKLRRWMHQLPIDPPFERGSLLFYAER